MEEEVWKEIPGYPNYQVSDQGRVKVLAYDLVRANGVIEHRKEKLLSLRNNPYKGNYYQVDLGSTKEGSRKTFYVHSLVALAFLGERPDGMEVCHRNGNSHDNRLVNLRYDTSSENSRDVVRQYGRQHRSKLTAKDAAEIRALHEEGYSYNDLAKRYGVVKGAIGHVLQGRAYGYVDSKGEVI